MSLQAKLISGEVDKPFVGSRVASFQLRMVQSAISISPASCSPLSSFVCVRIPSGMMHINIPNNRRHFVVAEEVRDRGVVTSAETATWRNVEVVDVQLLAIAHCCSR